VPIAVILDLHELNDYVPDRVKGLSEGRQHPVAARPAGIRLTAP